MIKNCVICGDESLGKQCCSAVCCRANKLLINDYYKERKRRIRIQRCYINKYFNRVYYWINRDKRIAYAKRWKGSVGSRKAYFSKWRDKNHDKWRSYHNSWMRAKRKSTASKIQGIRQLRRLISIQSASNSLLPQQTKTA